MPIPGISVERGDDAPMVMQFSASLPLEVAENGVTYPHAITPVPAIQQIETGNTVEHRNESGPIQASTGEEFIESGGIGPPRRYSEENLSTVENNIEEASPILREDNPAYSSQEEDIQPPSKMNAVDTNFYWATAIWELCKLSIEVRKIFDNEAQPVHDSSLRREHVEHYLDRIALEVSMIVQLVRKQNRAKEDKESSGNGPLRKLARMLERIGKGSVPALKNILKVGVTGSAVPSLTRTPLCVFKKR
jgi:hypothetical protein